MSNQEVKNSVAEVFQDLVTALETGNLSPKKKTGLTINGSEHGEQVMAEAANMAKAKDLFDIVLIGSRYSWTEDYEFYEADSESEIENKIDQLLEEETIDACVTLHHAFPIGVSTVGKILAPANNKGIFLATTTGTTSTNRHQAMVLNAINGIVAAKASGVKNPTVGILNLEGANTVERALKTLKDNGYPIHFGESKRADGGSILRGNDLLLASTDVVVTDSLTGNVLMKIFSAQQTGGHIEATGFGYGPGVGEDYYNNIHIVSRASGPSVIANAMEYAYQTAKGNLNQVNKGEYELANRAGLKEILLGLEEKSSHNEKEKIKIPDKEVVTESINGIDVLDLDEAVENLWKAGIYAESGMGCSGPIVLVNESRYDQAVDIVKEAGLL